MLRCHWRMRGWRTYCAEIESRSDIRGMQSRGNVLHGKISYRIGIFRMENRRRWSEMRDNRVHSTSRGCIRGMAEIIMRTNDLYRIHHMREQVYSIYRYHSFDYTVNRYLNAILFIRLSLISTDYLSRGNIQVSTNNYVRFTSTPFVSRKSRGTAT